MPNTHDATFYVQLEPDFFAYPSEHVRSIKAVRMTQQRPESPKPGTVVVKLTTRVPDAAFRPLQPEAVIEIPTDLTDAHPVQVTATDPTGG